MLMTMRRTICLLLLAFVCADGSAQDSSEQRMAIASKLAEYELKRVFGDDVIRELAQALPPQSRGDFIAFIGLLEQKEQIARALATAAAQTFTTAELQALLDFNSSPIGQSINSKQALYTRSSLAAMNREMKPL